MLWGSNRGARERPSLHIPPSPNLSQRHVHVLCRQTLSSARTTAVALFLSCLFIPTLPPFIPTPLSPLLSIAVFLLSTFSPHQAGKKAGPVGEGLCNVWLHMSCSELLLQLGKARLQRSHKGLNSGLEQGKEKCLCREEIKGDTESLFSGHRPCRAARCCCCSWWCCPWEVMPGESGKGGSITRWGCKFWVHLSADFRAKLEWKYLKQWRLCQAAQLSHEQGTFVAEVRCEQTDFTLIIQINQVKRCHCKLHYIILRDFFSSL